MSDKKWCVYSCSAAPWVSYQQDEFLQPGKLICDRCRTIETFILQLGGSLSEEKPMAFFEKHKECK